MHVYICMYVCMYVCMSVHIYIYYVLEKSSVLKLVISQIKMPGSSEICYMLHQFYLTFH
jgi:hypothetical protein